jgi:SRSO17 transposase
VFDVHKDQHIYTEPPVLFIPEPAQPGKGCNATRLKTESKALTVAAFRGRVPNEDFKPITVREGTKGALKSNAYYQEVYTRDGTSSVYQKRSLLIRVTDGRVKYTLTDADATELSLDQLVLMQAQRCLWKVPSWRNKQDMGMSEYQVRGRRAWHHHLARCIMAQGYVLEEKLLAKDDYPLLSAYGVSQVII